MVYKKEFLGKDPCACYEKTLDKQLDTVPPCCEGLFVVPLWGAALNRPEGKGAMVGFSESHTAIHVYRAIIEGINFELYKGMLSLEKKSGTKIQKIMVSGGGSQSDEVCQMTANLFGRPVVRVQTYETSGLGAAMCAFAELGVYKDCDEAVKNMVRETDKFIPDPKAHKIYSDFYNKVYKKSYKRLQPTLFSIKSINKEDNIMSKPYKGFALRGRKQGRPTKLPQHSEVGRPDYFKVPKEKLYKLLKKKFNMTDDDFRAPKEMGYEPVEFDALHKATEAQIAKFRKLSAPRM